MSLYDYIHDGQAIYKQSFATIRHEADLSSFTEDQARIAVRIIHACGRIEITEQLVFHPQVVKVVEKALQQGKPIFCDAEMVAHGITKRRLPQNNDIICTLNHPDTPKMAQILQNTRSAAAVHLWGDALEGAVVVIGNAPTTLFHLINLLEDKKIPYPAAIIGVPVGFVGAMESKEALVEWGKIPYLIVKGRQGGSAMAVAAINALAQKQEI
ncbi:precorrin-8X methylmutase [Commensalibacter papalotli (ex Botero et al. 2024)]|uniref:Precorrin-8X methylmutase CbiC/CobH (CobH) (PDB:1F2V) n=1 Tax=Commensalibacter papalotli (ex Botero et al. 2024) TaxID=2972766 RepID=A0ABN8WC08_9PROT|nr:precorrin-8X methylmutase [Commensalibacter papalotli (ex Botero et al. 2024)]CAI3953519.1 Precorrin-8X methylmutase CbiC/CobH (CobH) (PDB:1F2V) [Commensalibacter papalotli (ex Botero et al. 2024)]CAI3954023.1 Precorrin-8X methylmutase CbiC/CobH (CobH) (PDB:1F2V) [Commensalibacter papalotli (ex Botero et al. 2024)]